MEPENFVCSFTQLHCRTSAKGRIEIWKRCSAHRPISVVPAVSASKELQKKRATRVLLHTFQPTHSILGVNVCDDVGVIIMSHVGAESEPWPRLVTSTSLTAETGTAMPVAAISASHSAKDLRVAATRRGASLVLVRMAHALMNPKNR